MYYTVKNLCIQNKIKRRGLRAKYVLYFLNWKVFHDVKNIEIINMKTDKKENKIFLIYKEIQKGAVAKSKTNGLLIYD